MSIESPGLWDKREVLGDAGGGLGEAADAFGGSGAACVGALGEDGGVGSESEICRERPPKVFLKAVNFALTSTGSFLTTAFE